MDSGGKCGRSALTVSSNVKFGLFDAGTYPDFAEVKQAFESTYPCLGITCAHVGALPGTSSCSLEPIAGYIPGSDVTEHNKIDLDQKDMETALSSGDWTAATSAYATGGNSQSKGSYRTLQGFSTSAQSKMYECPRDTSRGYANGCPYTSYLPYYNYYGQYDYANQIVTAALDGTVSREAFIDCTDHEVAAASGLLFCSEWFRRSARPQPASASWWSKAGWRRTGKGV